MIAEAAADFAVRVRSVGLAAAFGLLGKASDTALKEIPLPAADLYLLHDQVDEDPYTPSSRNSPGMVPQKEVVLWTFAALVILPNVSESDILTNQYPLLEAVIAAVKGSGKAAPNGFRWRFIGQRRAFVSAERMAYQQLFTLNGVV